MDIENMKKGLSTLKLEKMSKVYNKKGEVDNTLIRATFSILDFKGSENKQVVPKKVGIDCMNTLLYKPLLCEYIPTTDFENPNDDFGDHKETYITLRNGTEYLSTATTPIGVCESVYIGLVKDDEGNEIDCIMGDYLLWLYRFPNEVSLINQFYENGETLYTSCEHYYKSSSFDEQGNEIIDSLIFDGHALLGRNIAPAYNTSKLISFNESWEKAVNKIKNKQNNSIKEEDIMENKIFEMLKSNNSISAGSIRWRIYDELAKIMTAEVYRNVYISEYDIYPEEHYFLYETYLENEGWKLFKCTYSVDTEDNVTVNYAEVSQVEYKVTVDLVQVEELQTSLNAKEEELKVASEKIEELETSLNSKIEELTEKDETIKSLNSQKEGVVEKFNNATELVTSLNSKVEELSETVETLKPLAEKYNEEQQTKALNSAIDSYKSVFNKAGANEVFEEESTMELIKKTLNSKVEIANDAKFQLNQLIIDNIKGIKVEKEDDSEPMVKSINSVVAGKETKGLVDNFVDPYEEYCGFSR